MHDTALNRTSAQWIGRKPIAHPRREARPTARRCPDCGTETTAWLGNVHKWRCRDCVAKVVGLAYRPSEPLPRRERIGRTLPPGREDAHGRPILEMPAYARPLTARPTTHPEVTQ